MQLSIIIPTLNEAERLPAWLPHLMPLHTQGAEIIVVDGGSHDASSAIVRQWGATLLITPPGRGVQMNAGARLAQGELLLFLHADTCLPAHWQVADTLARMKSGQQVWGRFAVTIQGGPRMLRLVAWMMNLRSCLTGVATGDQAIFVQRKAFLHVGGYPEQPLMEDIALSKRLRALSSPLCLRERVTTSGRRWEKFGVWHTIGLMWRLRWAYWRGVPATVLAERYPVQNDRADAP
ncbi:MAG: TIGR04283 family arsenosugar biosynthesis glycosyltransferase [Magnetococcus sp. MYC-9]